MIRTLGGRSLFVSRKASAWQGAGKQNSMGHADRIPGREGDRNTMKLLLSSGSLVHSRRADHRPARPSTATAGTLEDLPHHHGQPCRQAGCRPFLGDRAMGRRRGTTAASPRVPVPKPGYRRLVGAGPGRAPGRFRCALHPGRQHLPPARPDAPQWRRPDHPGSGGRARDGVLRRLGGKHRRRSGDRHCRLEPRLGPQRGRPDGSHGPAPGSLHPLAALRPRGRSA